MNRFTTNETASKKLLESIELANSVLKNPKFYEKLRTVKVFDQSDITGEILSNLILDSKITAQVIMKTPHNPFSNATAYTKPQFPESIFIYNKYVENRNVELADIVCTLAHEYLHLVDFEAEDYDFGHRNNYSSGKENTAPYLIETIAREIINNL